MKRTTCLSIILLVWMTASLSKAFAYDFSLIDSDGDVYQVGPFISKVMHNEAYYVKYISSSSFFPEGEGFLYYDDYYQSLKIIVFENDNIFGFTLEGHWEGSGSTIFYLNSDGQTGDMGLYFGDVLPRKRFKNGRIKNIIKGEKK